MLALLEESPLSWLTIADLARGAMNERGRHAWRVLTGSAEPAVTAGQRFWLTWIAAGVISVGGWFGGVRLDPYVPDDLNGLHLLLGFLTYSVFYTPRVDGPPVYVVHPLNPSRLLRIRAPFHFPRLPSRWGLPLSTSCFVLFAIGQGAMPSPSHGAIGGSGFFQWFWSVFIAVNWTETILERPKPTAPTTS